MFTIKDFNINESLVDCLFAIDKEYPHRKGDFYKSLSGRILQQNMWWAEELHKLDVDKKTLNIYGAGFCFYQASILANLPFTNIILYDIDNEVRSVNWKALNHLRKNKEIEQRTLDVILDKEFVRTEVHVVINTSCECMYDMKHIVNDYSKDTLFVFQGTSEMSRGNINVHTTLDEFKNSTGITQELYSGTLLIDSNNRFMVIGYA